MKEFKGVALIEDAAEWLEFRRNTKRLPTTFPVVGWYEEVDFGLGCCDDMSFFREIPKAIIEEGNVDSWVLGFREGIRFVQ